MKPLVSVSVEDVKRMQAREEPRDPVVIGFAPESPDEALEVPNPFSMSHKLLQEPIDIYKGDREELEQILIAYAKNRKE